MRPLVRIGLYVVLASGSAAALAVGCSEDVTESGTAATGPTAGTGASSGTSTSTNTASGGANAGGAGTGAGTGTSSASYTSGVGGAPTTIATCQGHVYQCGDLIDNDGDGLIDSQDPDCLGPCDNTEDSYYGGIPGQAGPACTVDCYFDQDSGSGNDDCHWNHKCDPHEVAPGYNPEHVNGTSCAYDPNANTPGTGASCDEMYNTQSQQCLNYCGPLTPNGCDCFGCCELPAGGGKYVWLGSENPSGTGSCTLADVADPAKCEPCEPVKACLNGCDHCELCIGKTTLPPDCFPDAGTTTSTGQGGASSSSTGVGGAIGQCPSGVQPCGLPGEQPCMAGFYCITGCCQVNPP